MPIRELLRGILKRTNSSHSASSSTAISRSSSATTETRPTTSSGADTARHGDKARFEEIFPEDSLRVSTALETRPKESVTEAASSSKSTTNDDGVLVEAGHARRGSAADLGVEEDRRLSAEGIKLHDDQTAETSAGLSAPAHGLREQQQEERQQRQQSAKPACHGRDNPLLLVHCATPDRVDSHVNAELPLKTDVSETPQLDRLSAGDVSTTQSEIQSDTRYSISPAVSPGTEIPAQTSRPSQGTIRRQSIITGANSRLIRTLLDSGSHTVPLTPLSPPVPDYFGSAVLAPATTDFASMLTRKIWVKRPGASATMVTIKEDDLVDDVRDMILRKYANSLGRSFDSPDVALRIVSRAEGLRGKAERLLGPDEEMCRTLDTFYPGGQMVDDALLIDVPQRRTPRASPRIYQQHNAAYHALDDFRPAESGSDYFPPMPAVIPPSAPHSTTSASAAEARLAHQPNLHLEHNRSIAVLATGQLPPLPSPGSVRRIRGEHRPKYGRQHTSSPTILTHNPNAAAPPAMPSITTSQHLPIRTRARGSSNASEQPHLNPIPAPPPLPTPPAPEAVPTAMSGSNPSTPATTLRPARPRRSRKPTPTNGTPSAKSPSGIVKPAISSLLDNSVPPINVLIVEDNIINLKLLEAFMKRLKVRWSTAMNGQIAVNKWRAGGFHLVLMDIQLPIMSGLEATKEIRRLERVNGIGVFSNSAPPTPAEGEERPQSGVSTHENKVAIEGDDDKLNVEQGLFKSPVIIVALTASSLQSDRHEALAAGCNDFLTKPVNFVWLERKVKEWGCMQALIDFDGWRKWKDFASSKPDTATKGLPSSDAAAKAKERRAKRTSRASLEAPIRPLPVSDAAAPALQNGSAVASEEAPAIAA